MLQYTCLLDQVHAATHVLVFLNTIPHTFQNLWKLEKWQYKNLIKLLSKGRKIFISAVGLGAH